MKASVSIVMTGLVALVATAAQGQLGTPNDRALEIARGGRWSGPERSVLHAPMCASPPRWIPPRAVSRCTTFRSPASNSPFSPSSSSM